MFSTANKGYSKVAEPRSESVAMRRLREAVHAINILLPSPITLESAVSSADGVRKLAKGQRMAKTYSACLRKLDCLNKHVYGCDNPSLDAVVKTHAENVKRMADTCAACLIHLFISVGTSEGTDDFLEETIKLTSATETTMQDISMAEKALGLKPLSSQCRRGKLTNGIDRGVTFGGETVYEDELSSLEDVSILAPPTISEERVQLPDLKDQCQKKTAKSKNRATATLEAV